MWQVDELYGIHYLTLIWGRPVTNGGPPSCRDGHSAAFDGVNRYANRISQLGSFVHIVMNKV